jgi:hypothetical protein
VWIREDMRPVAHVTGSHEHSTVFGALSIDGRQLFRQYDNFDEDTFLDYLKKLHAKFPKCYLFLDKAPPHYKLRKVQDCFNERRDSLI